MWERISGVYSSLLEGDTSVPRPIMTNSIVKKMLT